MLLRERILDGRATRSLSSLIDTLVDRIEWIRFGDYDSCRRNSVLLAKCDQLRIVFECVTNRIA